MKLGRNNEVRVEKTDQCNTCAHYENCPLIEALAAGIVLMSHQDFAVKNCGMYEAKEPKPAIKRVK